MTLKNRERYRVAVCHGGPAPAGHQGVEVASERACSWPSSCLAWQRGAGGGSTLRTKSRWWQQARGALHRRFGDGGRSSQANRGVTPPHADPYLPAGEQGGGWNCFSFTRKKNSSKLAPFARRLHFFFTKPLRNRGIPPGAELSIRVAQILLRFLSGKGRHGKGRRRIVCDRRG